MIIATNLEMKNTPPLTFTLEAGLTHGLVGANGIGKTTLLRMMAGQHHSGNLTVLGQAPFDNSEIMDRTILMGIDNPLFSGWNVRKLCRLGQARWSTWNQARAEELLARFKVPPHNYSALSRGQKSALGFIFAVASGCELLPLDEPYLGLDVQGREVFRTVLREEQGKRTIVVSTHHLNEISGLLDTILLLADAPLVGPVDTLIEDIVALRGPAPAVNQAVANLQLPVLERESAALGDKVLIDARGTAVERVFAQAAELHLRASEVSLEEAVLALGGAR